MKVTLHLLALLLLISSNILAQDKIQSDVRVFSFQADEGNVMAELYMAVLSESIQAIDSQSAKSVEVKVVVRSNDEIKLADKYVLNQASASAKDFYHIQRFLLKPGKYSFEINIKDLAEPSRETTSVLTADLKTSDEDVAISSVQLLGNVQKDENANPLAKNGLIMEPLKFNYLNNNYNQIRAYFEVYNTQLEFEGDYILKYDLVHVDGESRDTVLTRYKRRKAEAIDPVLITEKNDTSYQSGSYELKVAVLDFEKNVKSMTQTEFVISNPTFKSSPVDVQKSFASKLSQEDLQYALRALAPKVNQADVERLNHLIAKGARESQVSFLYQFWSFYTPINPEFGYNEYMKVVKALDNMYYDGLGHGFETDRGYIYLKYGRPDQQIAVEDEPNAPPYEIWIYADFPATRQNNVKFVFYNPSSTTYELLHTNARGELNDPQWLIKLYRNSPEDVIGNTIDAREVQDNWNRQAAQIYNDN